MTFKKFKVINVSCVKTLHVVMSGTGILFLFLFLFFYRISTALGRFSYWLSADLSASLLFERCLVRCIVLGWVRRDTQPWWSHGSTAWRVAVQWGAVQWNLMEGTKQGQTAFQLVYKESPHRCIFPRLNIFHTTGLVLSEALGLQ